MTEKIEKKLYGGEVSILFYPTSHRYQLQGRKDYLISATGATGIIDKSRPLIFWAIGLAGDYLKEYVKNCDYEHIAKEELLPIIDEALIQHTKKKIEAANIGTQIHDYAMKFGMAKITGTELPAITNEMDNKVVAGINAFLEWINTNKIEFLECERMIYSKQHKFVGITDLVAIVNGKKLIVDYKSGKGMYSDYNYQVAAYRGAYEEENGKVDGGLILHFDKLTGELSTKELTDEDHKKDYPVFLACLTIKQREKELSK